MLELIDDQTRTERALLAYAEDDAGGLMTQWSCGPAPTLASPRSGRSPRAGHAPATC